MARYQLSGQSSSDATSYLATWLTRRHLNENRCPLFRRDNGIVANGAATQYVSPPVPLCPPSIRVSIHVRILQHTEHGTKTKTKTNQRINATNTRGEEWLIENLYHPVWYSFISGIYTGIIDSILHMCIILHASTLRTVETVFFSLSFSLASILERNDWNFFWIGFPTVHKFFVFPKREFRQVWLTFSRL